MKIILTSKERAAVEAVLYAITVEVGCNRIDFDDAVTRCHGVAAPGMGQTELTFDSKYVVAALNAVHELVRIGANIGRTVYALLDVAKGAVQNVERKFLDEVSRADE